MLKKLIAGLVILFAIAIPANADLIWKGSDLSRRTQIEKIYKGFPSRGKDIDVNIFMQKKEDYELIDIVTGGGSLGLYFNELKTMALLKEYKTKKDGDIIPIVFTHEYGHHVYFQALTDKEKDDWEVYWSNNLPIMPRDYARVSPVEGFAECFAITYSPKIPSFYTANVNIQTKIRTYFVEGVAWKQKK